MNNMTEQEKQVLTAGLILAGMFIIIIGYLYFMFWRGAMDENRELIGDLRTEIRTMETRIQEIEDVLQDEERYQRLLAQVERAKQRLPDDQQAFEFLDLLTDSLNKTGVNVANLDRVPTISRAMYIEIPYQISGSARYHEFGQFLNLIESHPERFMRVSEFNLTNNTNRPSIHPMDARIQTFMFKGA